MTDSFIEFIKVFIMAVVQGIGEFLPISSSGHLLVLGNLFFGNSDFENDLTTLGILLHAGTLLSILIIFRRQIWDMLSVNRRLILLIIIASVPTAIAGFVIRKKFDFLESNLFIAGIGFLVTAWLIFKIITSYKKTSYELYFEEVDDLIRDETESSVNDLKTLTTMTFWDAFIVGCFQSIAILPGCSRSGFTIAAGMLRNLKREDAASFSFLIAIPAIGGAALLEFIDLWQEQGTNIFSDPDLMLFLLGSFVSFVIGIFSLIFLLKWLKDGKLHYFGYWLLILGPAVIAWQIWEMFIGKSLFNF